MFHTRPPRAQRFALLDWAAKDNYSHAITLNTDRELTLPRVKDICSTFLHEIDRKMLGRRPDRADSHCRVRAILFPENLATNAHLHGAMDLQQALRKVGSYSALDEMLEKLWRKATRGAGSISLKEDFDRGWFTYCTKRFDGTFFLAADFHPH